ncbi:MAG: hypothetical protein JO103_11600 [Candidatus Eremiobacteraeota bacterium]|nr:hypothetical protein [Candidatus Eremiobacteraeota bacterium]MBV9408822.1 hypothetical protein [Candidatus Eremiobacteraeota bacterium]
MAGIDVASLAAWTPVRVRDLARAPVVEWALVDAPFAEPFFEQTADHAMRHPFNQVFKRRTPLAVFDDLADVPAVTPSGFIFHMSRAGSTLVAQMLAALDASLVISEAQPFDALVTLRRAGRCDDATFVRRLRGMAAAFVRPFGGARRLFVKWNASHALELPLIARAFPGVPWMFLFREPRAVLASHRRASGAEAFGGPVDAALYGMDPAAVPSMNHDEYTARAVAAFGEAALRHANVGRGRFVDYAALPAVVVDELLPFFGVEPTAGERARMHAVTARDAKRPDTTFRADAVGAPVPPDIDRLAARWLDPVCARLRAQAER